MKTLMNSFATVTLVAVAAFCLTSSPVALAACIIGSGLTVGLSVTDRR